MSLFYLSMELSFLFTLVILLVSITLRCLLEATMGAFIVVAPTLAYYAKVNRKFKSYEIYSMLHLRTLHKRL